MSDDGLGVGADGRNAAGDRLAPRGMTRAQRHGVAAVSGLHGGGQVGLLLLGLVVGLVGGIIAAAAIIGRPPP